MGVHEAQTAQSGGLLPLSPQLGDNDAVPIANDNHVGSPLAIYQQTDLTADFPAQGGQLAGLLLAVSPEIGEASAVKMGQGLGLAGFESCGVTPKFFGYNRFLLVTVLSA